MEHIIQLLYGQSGSVITNDGNMAQTNCEGIQDS